MRGIINVSAVLLSSAVLSQKTNRPIVTSIPTIWCMLMILLQLLSYGHGLNSIDWISVLIVIGSVAFFYRQRRTLRKTIKECLLHPSFAVLLLLIACAVFLNRNAFVSAWDDVNYWAASVRSLFERNGLEGKYYTVSAGWGDYPLGQQLIEWWFVHTFSGKWSEKWVYIGYYVLLFSFIASFFDGISHKWYSVLGAAIVGLLLAMVHIDDGNIQRLNADLLLAVAYGCCIYSILQLSEKKIEDTNWADVMSISIQLAGIVMIKSTGILWSISAAVLYYLLRNIRMKDADKPKKKETQWLDGALLAPAAVIYISWQLACKLLARETYLVNYLRSSEVISWEWHFVQAKKYLYMVFFKPAVQIPIGENTLGLSSGALIFIPCLFFLYLWKYREQRKKNVLLCLFVLTTIIVYLFILLYSYETMFVYEPQALNSVPRYLLPCTFLVKVVLWEIYENCPQKTPDKWYGPLIIGMILLLSYNTVKLPKQIKDNLSNVNAYPQAQNAYKERFSEFYEQLDNMEDRLNASVLYCSQDISEYDRIYLCYLAEGTAVNLCANLNPEEMSEQLTNMHATHVVICSNGEYCEMDYQELMSGEEGFTFGKLYKIDETGKLALSQE